MVATQRSTKNSEEKTLDLAQYVFDLCAADIHKKHAKNTARSVANQIYDSKAFYYTGLISVKAKEALEEGFPRSKLCKEHFITRTKTTIDLFSHFDNNFGKIPNNQIIEGLKDIVISGCHVNLVLSSENNELSKHQKDRNLDPMEPYIKAKIQLVQDTPPKQKQYIHAGKTYSSQVELAADLNKSVSTIGKWAKKGLIEVKEI